MGAKTLKLSLDFTDQQELMKHLEAYSLRTGETQREVVIRALKLYFSSQFEDGMLLRAADQSFAAWSNSDDEAFDKL